MIEAQKQKILIADDSEINRAILADMLEGSYEIIEAENGVQAVEELQKYGCALSLVLLDIIMPEMDGFGVLAAMNRNHWIEDIPVIMISADSQPASIERAYTLGITDFISRPFDALIVHHRVVNTILLYAKQKKLVSLVEEQVRENARSNTLMIDILSHIVEFRNGESGLHVLHIRALTEFFLRHLVQKDPLVQFTQQEISLISTASALHDIGKIAIDTNILNKPGRLTPEEFQIMKTHAALGASMLKDLTIHQGEPLVKYAYEICRWHHERYDGRGYPDGLKGGEIPISAQVVALADVYDALTSERVYKKAYPHETAVQMILDGQCGTFNPLLMNCLRDLAPSLPARLAATQDGWEQASIRGITDEMLRQEDPASPDRAVQLLERERMKQDAFASMSREVQFEYRQETDTVSLSAQGARLLGLPELLSDPLRHPALQALFTREDFHRLQAAVHSASPDHPVARFACPLRLGGKPRWMEFTCQALYESREHPVLKGVIGKAVDIHEAKERLDALEEQAVHDDLTGLPTQSRARSFIERRLREQPEGRFVLAIVNLDHFRALIEERGRRFGDQVLIETGARLRQAVGADGIAARVSGVDFLLFSEYNPDAAAFYRRIASAMTPPCEGVELTVSIGAATTADATTEYDALFHAADHALTAAKRMPEPRPRILCRDASGTVV